MIKEKIIERLNQGGLMSAREVMRAPAIALGASSRSPYRSKRAYSAAVSSRFGSSWATQPQTMDATLRNSLPVLRARSRDQYHNNDFARRFVNMVRNHVAGPDGVSMQARIVDPDGSPDDGANDAIEAAWSDWGLPDVCDISGSLSWVQMQQLYAGNLALDGEVLIYIHEGRSAGPHGLQLQFIDPEALPADYHNPRKGIRFGIEYNDNMRPVAYHIASETGDGTYTFAGRTYRRIPAKYIIHDFIVEQVGQRRGVPWMASALERMHNLKGYEQAAVTAARIGASKGGFFISPDGEGIDGEEQSDGSLIMDVEPGTYQQLPEGYDFKAYDPTYPHDQYPEFVKAQLRGIASGLGVSYNALASDLEGVNYSSIRQGVQEEREVWKALQRFMIDRFCRRVYDRWLVMALMLGVPTVGGRPLRFDRLEKYRRVDFQGRRWSWIDPLKDMQAQLLAINNGLKSRSEVIRETGRDPGEVWREIEREAKEMSAHGVAVGASNSNSNMQDEGDANE